MKVKYLEIDDDVNVFVVGDIHSCYTQLKDKLKEVGFNAAGAFALFMIWFFDRK